MREESALSMRRALKVVEILALTMFTCFMTGCATPEDEDLAAVKRQPLAASTLLGMESTTYVESGRNTFGDAYVFRMFESDDLSDRRLLAAIRDVGLDSGWTTWECEKVGNVWLLRMGKGNPGFWTDIQVDHRSVVVKVGKHRPGVHSFVPEQPETSHFPC